MKFVHIGDLHLGKMLHQYSLLDIQKDLLSQLLDYMDRENLKVLVIAGDIYDRSVPPLEAVNVLDEFLDRAINELNIKVLMISGNHDSSDRLNFASSLLRKEGLYIETQVHKEMKPVVIDDVKFYLLPFFKPSLMKRFSEQTLVTYQDALAYYLSQQIFEGRNNILVTHQFVGKNSIRSESESTLSVGGTEIIDASVFDAFDYVALGHLHAPQKVERETIRYSGSLMKYSFNEVNQRKSITIVDTDDYSISFHELEPKIDVRIIRGEYVALIKESSDDLLMIELLDDKIIPYAVDHLRVRYPHLLQIIYPNITKKNHIIHDRQELERKTLLELYQQFYHHVNDKELDQEYIDLIIEMKEESGQS